MACLRPHRREFPFLEEVEDDKDEQEIVVPSNIKQADVKTKEFHLNSDNTSDSILVNHMHDNKSEEVSSQNKPQFTRLSTLSL